MDNLKPLDLREGATMAIVPMEEQPDWRYIHHDVIHSAWVNVYRPYAVGDRVFVQERWRLLGGSFIGNRQGDHVECKISCTHKNEDGTTSTASYNMPDIETYNKYKKLYTRWQPASTMPELFARKFAKVTSCEPKRGSEIDYPEIESLGFKSRSPEAVLWMHENHDKYNWLVEAEVSE